MKMEPNFQLAQTKLSLRHLAEHGTVDEIEKLLACIREVTPRIENRIVREKIAIAKMDGIGVKYVDGGANTPLTT